MTPTRSSAAAPAQTVPIPAAPEITHIVAEVAAAVGLAEGGAGVHDILATVAGREPVAVRELSRAVEIPVPVVAAVCQELRRRGVVDQRRPVRLTPYGRSALAGTAAAPADRCGACHGRGTVLPRRLHHTEGWLAELATGAPPARPELDQTHCTADTKLRRVMFLARHGLLSRRIVLLGDDDLTSLAIAHVASALGLPAPRLAVVDVDPRVLDYVGRHAAAAGLDVQVLRHDLVRPLPDVLRGAFDVAVTDPPYTIAGAELFVSRAVAALRPGAGGHVVLAFGARRPDEAVRLQGLFAEMALAVRSLTPHFNEYVGAGVLGGTSHLYHLRTTTASRPTVPGVHSGPLHTADSRPSATRHYRCADCRSRVPVGPGERHRQIAHLREQGCPHCGGRRFRPLSRRQDGGQA